MKRVLRNPIFTFILGIVLCGSVGVVATNLASSKVAYDNTTSHSSKTTVQDAIDDLYDKAKHEDTLTLTSSQTSTIDMGENHNYRFIDPSAFENVSGSMDDVIIGDIQATNAGKALSINCDIGDILIFHSYVDYSSPSFSGGTVVSTISIGSETGRVWIVRATSSTVTMSGVSGYGLRGVRLYTN